MKKITDDTLWNFADELLSNDQHKEIEILMKNDPLLRQRVEAIFQQKTLLFGSGLEQPNADFSAKLLAQWTLENSATPVEIVQNSTNLFVLKAIFSAFIVLSISLLCIAFSNNTVSEPLPIEIPNIDFSWSKISFLLVSILAMLSVRLFEKVIVFRSNVLSI